MITITILPPEDPEDDLVLGRAEVVFAGDEPYAGLTLSGFLLCRPPSDEVDQRPVVMCPAEGSYRGAHHEVRFLRVFTHPPLCDYIKDTYRDYLASSRGCWERPHDPNR